VGPSGRIDLVAVRFQSAGAALICDDLGALTDTWADVKSLAVPDLVDWQSALSRTLTADERIRLLDAMLARLATRRTGPDADVAAAVRAIDDSHGMVALESLAATLGCSMRHLQRRFSRQVGVSPKMLARIRRFQRVFQAWRDDPRSLSRVAVECGYFDQPHLIRDFRDFAGSAPAAFLANQPEFTRLFLPTNSND
jgi:AraC-like DNA-binding protein